MCSIINNLYKFVYIPEQDMLILFIIVVLIQGYCCAVKIDEGHNLGPSMFHAYECGAGISPFLKVRECEAFVLRYHQKGKSKITVA